MALSECLKIGTKNSKLYMNVFSGHFSTGRSHTNYYIDITAQKCCLSEAKAVAEALEYKYKAGTLIDTILCLDDTQTIGTCLANELTREDFGYGNINSGNTIYILTPEQTNANQLIFRDNIVPMIKNKNVLIMAASVVTGYTVNQAMEAVNYYSGNVVGVASIFATVDRIGGVPVNCVFNPHDLPGYECCSPGACSICKAGGKLDALVNNYGFSKL